MPEALALDQLRISPFRSSRQPLPWPTPTELARASRTGLIEPVTARILPGTQPPEYEILAGLKSWLLAQRLGLSTVPVLIREVSDVVARRWVEAESTTIVRRDPIAEARALQQRVAEGRSIAAAGREFGLSRTDASHRIRLLRLHPEVQARIASGQLAPGTARMLVGLQEAQQCVLAARIQRERLSTRQVEALVRSLKKGQPASLSSSQENRLLAHDPDQIRLESVIAELLGTPVTLRYGPDGQGDLIIHFSNLDIFDHILECLGYADSQDFE